MITAGGAFIMTYFALQQVTSSLKTNKHKREEPKITLKGLPSQNQPPV